MDVLLKIVDNNTSVNDDDFILLDSLSDKVADYEEKYMSIDKPLLIDVVRLRMEELNLKQKDLAELLGTSTTRISEYLKDKRQITLEIAKRLHIDLNIDASIIL
ncbi:MAG: helix-turn-helix domain-containing protein [Flavobacteriaceae bacterium]|nr:helix-turn-helix domain-containing protein [Flavobacteriaceae bacterium]